MKTQFYIEKMLKETSLSEKDISERLQKKKAELKGLVSDEGALYIIVTELGLSFQDYKM